MPKHSTVRRLPLVTGKDVDDSVLLREVTHYYHEVLKQRPEALSYLQDRGLRSGEIIEHFNLGFADRTLAYRLPPRGRRDGAELRSRLQHLGILRESGHEHLNGSLVIPITDAAGNVVQLYGRKITPMLEGGADIRYIQAMLGHALLSTTQVYTHVSIRQLKHVHTTTHPAAALEPRPTPELDETVEPQVDSEGNRPEPEPLPSHEQLARALADEDDEDGEEEADDDSRQVP